MSCDVSSVGSILSLRDQGKHGMVVARRKRLYIRRNGANSGSARAALFGPTSAVPIGLSAQALSSFCPLDGLGGLQ